MKKILLFINLFVNANCLCLPVKDKKENIIKLNFIVSNEDLISILNNSTKEIQTSVDQLSESVAENMKQIKEWQNSSNSKMFEHDLNEIQKNLIMNTNISKDLQKNMDKLLTFVYQLSKEHKKTSSILKTFGHQLDEIQEFLLQMEMRNLTFQNKTQNLAEDCKDVFNLGEKDSTSYMLHKYNRTVNCDMETDGGGWLVIQQRKKVTNQVNFNTTWASYKKGFGALDTEFWIGNEFLHRITNQKSYELRIDIEDFKKGPFYASYSKFQVENKESGYKLHLGEYKGNVTDELKYYNGQKFATFDRDNDYNCAKLYGAFWYNDCGFANINGVFPTDPNKKKDDVMTWYHNGEYLILIKVQMKIRPNKEQTITV